MTGSPLLYIIDDERSARDTLQALLAADNYRLQLFSTGPEALEAMARSAPDLLLADVMMPSMDGFEFCRTVKAHAEWRFIPIVLITALDGQDDMVRGIEAGADEFLTKPIQRVVLRARARAMLRIRGQYLQLRSSVLDLDSMVKARREQIVSAAGLSAREREVLDLLLLGRTHDEIGVALGISTRTSKYHLNQILEKLGADSRNDLSRIFL